MRKTTILAMLALLLTGMCSCGFSFGKKQEEKRENLDFTVVSEERLPEALKEIVTQKKEEPFKVTYMDEGYLYICIGYGKQETGGYSITVNDLYMTENAVYVDTNLIGPKKAEQETNKKKEELKTPSYPYIVIKTEYRDKTVVFN